MAAAPPTPPRTPRARPRGPDLGPRAADPRRESRGRAPAAGARRHSPGGRRHRARGGPRPARRARRGGGLRARRHPRAHHRVLPRASEEGGRKTASGIPIKALYEPADVGGRDAARALAVACTPSMAVVVLAMYVAAARRRGVALDALAGTCQNDFLMECAVTTAPAPPPPPPALPLPRATLAWG